MLIDLHAHTRAFSYDASLSPDDLVAGARAAGLDGVCLTEHDWFWDHEEVRALARRHDFLVIPGCEINTEEGHMLVFGLRAYQFGMHRASFLAEAVERAGGAMLAAHPYRRYFTEDGGPGALPYAEQLARALGNGGLRWAHGIEVLNGRGSPAQNRFARDLGARWGAAGAGASDSHGPDDVGTCATEFEARIEGLEDLVRELRAGRFRPVRLRGEPGG